MPCRPCRSLQASGRRGHASASCQKHGNAKSLCSIFNFMETRQTRSSVDLRDCAAWTAVPQIDDEAIFIFIQRLLLLNIFDIHCNRLHPANPNFANSPSSRFARSLSSDIVEEHHHSTLGNPPHNQIQCLADVRSLNQRRPARS